MRAKRAGRLGFAGAGLAVALLTASAATQPPANDPLIPAKPDEAVTAFAACARCHNYRSKADAAKDPFAQDFKSHEFVLLSEGTTWRQQDTHSNTFKVLASALGRQMSDILKKTGKPEYKEGVTKAAACLTCHAIDITPAAPLAEKKFDTEDGVTCNACHGLRSPWQIGHFAEGPVNGKKGMPWRLLGSTEKEQAGQRNLRDPAVAARLCASCHVGRPDEGKVITHEMLAAGHPILPPFELVTFIDGTPPHWRPPTDPESRFFTPEVFAAFAGAEFVTAHPNWQWELYRFHPAEREVYAARRVAVGAIVALQAEARLLAAEAERVARGSPAPGSPGLDFAALDCSACHADIRFPGNRPIPAAPPPRPWPAALAGVVADHATGLPDLADTARGFRPRWEALQAAVQAKPFGDPARVRQAAAEVDAWCAAFLAKVENGGKPLYTSAETKRLLAAIADEATSAKWTADPEAAMHLTWAYLSLRDHGGEKIPDEKLKALGRTVPVRVRFPPYSTDKNEPRPAGEEIGPRLELLGRFRSQDFLTRFRDVSGSRPGK
jgi:hypothetical protein